ncbi:hypothetical protein Zmor_012367 [Zophobas morio]|uniref:DNA-directed RNA polymerase subunit n=1 Tax=Zophobas morio TaxID=2755281 RepID=A0AA38HIE3_9CUCU|nr:hypothetical protein Zmor_012367 [Zophobas morio]
MVLKGEADLIFHQISSVYFGIYDDQELVKLSVKEITNPIPLDDLLNPTQNGLYDPALGPFNPGDICKTCFLSYMHCPGHFGHIKLSLPVYNPVFFNTAFLLLRACCFYCYNFKASRLEVYELRSQLLLLQYGLLKEAIALPSLLDSYMDSLEEAVDENNLGKTRIHCIDSLLKRVFNENNIYKENKNKSVNTIHINAFRQKLVAEFLKNSSFSKCKNCSGINRVLKKNKSSKVYVLPLTQKDRKKMLAHKIFLLDKEAPDSAFVLNPKESILQEETTLLSAHNAKLLLEKVWDTEHPLLCKLFRKSVLRAQRRLPSMFFIETLAVSPPRFRPISRLDEKIFENPQTTSLKKIIETSNQLLKTRYEVFQVNKKRQTEGAEEGNEKVSNMQPGLLTIKFTRIRQLLEKKDGLFRKHMMGKRVNYACRSVISPDPYIGTHEIGIPMLFATDLTYPQPVTAWNINELRQLVINGPLVHPGATHLITEKNATIALGNITLEQRTALANQLLTPPEDGYFCNGSNKKVLRHIKNGDIVLVNRQPTLHKPSIMAHTVRVLPGEKTLRLHYANCNTYNADFDGDEMNVHFPQSEHARAEAYFIANTDNQYLVPTSGAPLRGLIQDHVCSGAVLTARNTFFCREQYQQLLYAALSDQESKVKLLPPVIWKPQPLWTGKLLVSTILLNVTLRDRDEYIGFTGICLNSISKTPAHVWGPNCEENEVVVRGGELLCGVLDKSQFGASSYGLVHAVQELYGGEVAGALLTSLGRLFTAYLQFRGLSCGVEDLVLTRKAEKKRTEFLKRSHYIGKEELANVSCNASVLTEERASREVLQEIYRSSEKMAALDAAMKSSLNKLTSDVISKCLPVGQRKSFPANNLSLMISTGAKGSSVNLSQISCLLGQQELEGRRVPIMKSGRSLPSFLPYDASSRSSGYVVNRFLTGLKPQEYYFHCMAGREGLVDTAVKTARSGYLQRCLIKHMEGLKVAYDLTVRDGDQSIIQFIYGEDGIDVLKTSYLNNFDFIKMNESSMLAKLNFVQMQRAVDTTKAIKYWKKLRKSKRSGNQLPPVLSVYSPSLFLGSVSEKFAIDMRTFISRDKECKTKKEAVSRLRWLSYAKYRQCLVEPGESVGLLSAQSLGEPSTQMTLNTFHFAGFGAMNVTLGIPRLCEILMTASRNIKTPMMRVPIRSGPRCKELAANIKHRLNKITLSQVLHESDGDSSSSDQEEGSTLSIDNDSDSSAISDDDDKAVQFAPSTQDLPESLNYDSSLRSKRIARLHALSSHISEYDYDEDGNWAELTLNYPVSTRKLLLTSLIESMADSVVIRSTSGINRCVVSETSVDNVDQLLLQTEGVNIPEMWKYYNILEMNKIICNDIHQILEVYGVEAARITIVREISEVFKVYGIIVNVRHLSVIADLVTFEGGYKPFNRMGLQANTSPFLRMSFESTMSVLRETALYIIHLLLYYFFTYISRTGDCDAILTPSSSLVVGKPVECGTGAFELVQAFC